MGNGPSTANKSNNGPCNECDCESEVPRVIAECNKAGENALSTTLKQTITSLVGKETSDIVTKEYETAVIGNNINPKWVSAYNNVKQSQSGFIEEGFIEGNDECVQCDCRVAANDIIEDCKKATRGLSTSIDSLIKDADIQSSLKKLIPSNEEETNNDWETIYNQYITQTTTPIEATKSTEPFKLMEGFIAVPSTMGLYNVTRVSLQERHDQFKNTDTFQTDCRNNSYRSIIDFIIEEKQILDDLYNYYLTFIKDYESLYLHKESFSKTIANKLDELQKIQKKIDSYKTNLHVDNRKNLYQTNNYDFYTNIRFYILIVYYSVLILYLIFSKFISEKQYKNKLIALLLFLYLIMPIILQYLINFVYQGYIFFLEYNNLKEDTKSYEDIINKN
jgi:hypothetical protein